MRIRTRTLVLAATLLTGLCHATPVHAQQQETPLAEKKEPVIITFDAPGAGNCLPGALYCSNFTNCFGACPGTVATAANGDGTVIGYYVDNNNVYHGFVRCPDEKIETLDVPGAGAVPGSGQGTVPYAINSEGAIAGEFQAEDNKYHAFLRSPQGHFTIIDIPHINAGAFQGTFATAINDAGEIAGFYQDGNSVNHGFVRHPKGEIETFNAPNDSEMSNFAPQGTIVASSGSALNSKGEVTGWYFDSSQSVHGYVRVADGTITEFIDKDGGTGAFQGTYSGSVNPEGVTVGAVLNGSTVYEGLIRFPNGDMKTFEVPGSGNSAGTFQGTFAVGINPKGVLTAYYTDSQNITYGAVVDSEGHVETFGAEGAGTNMGQGTTPNGINENGVVVGYYTDSTNINHGFLRIPAKCHNKYHEAPAD